LENSDSMASLKIIIAVIALIAVIGIAFALMSQKPEYPDIANPIPVKGNPDAKVIVEEFSDFQCPACISTFPYVQEIINNNKDKIRFEYRQFPLPSHNYAFKSSEASLCAQDAGKFWEYHDELFKAKGVLDSESLVKYAERVGIDKASFNNCLYSGTKEAKVNAEISAGQDRGVNGTPTFFVNRKKIEGIYLSEIIANLKAAIASEIAGVE